MIGYISVRMNNSSIKWRAYFSGCPLHDWVGEEPKVSYPNITGHMISKSTLFFLHRSSTVTWPQLQQTIEPYLPTSHFIELRLVSRSQIHPGSNSEPNKESKNMDPIQQIKLLGYWNPSVSLDWVSWWGREDCRLLNQTIMVMAWFPTVLIEHNVINHFPAHPW